MVDRSYGQADGEHRGSQGLMGTGVASLTSNTVDSGVSRCGG